MRRWLEFGGVGALIAAAVAVSAVLGPDALASNTTNYNYDAWGRATAATYSGSGNLITGYAYDPAGNRTQVATASPPVANPVAFGIAESTSYAVVTLSVSGPYTSIAVGSGPAHGTTSINGTTLKYKPTAGYVGPDSFTYTATNGSGTSPPAAVQIVVAAAPTASNVSVNVQLNSVSNNVPLSVSGPYTAAAVSSAPSHGVALATETLITYTPNAGYSGTDTFHYTASNTVATSSAATVTVAVNIPPPVANNFSATVTNNTSNNPMPLNITGGTPTSVTVSTQASHGMATASGVGINYTPTTNYVGPDSFNYTASNAGGTSPPALGQISVIGLTATLVVTLNCPSPGPAYYVCATGTGGSHTFTGSPVSVSVTGGVGPYTYSWTAIGDGFGTWTTGQTTASITPAVSGAHVGGSSASYTCTVTDTSTGHQATSADVIYTWYNTS